MLNIFLFLQLSISWKYPTFDELDVQCSICQYITHRFENDTSQIDLQLIPQKDTLCDTDKNDDICQVTEAIAKKFQSATNKTNYCTRTGFCPEELPPGIIGQKCRICMMLSKHIYNYPIDDRKTAIHNFCNTSNLITSIFCGDLYDEGIDIYLDDLEDIKNHFTLCKLSHYCRDDPTYKKENNDEL